MIVGVVVVVIVVVVVLVVVVVVGHTADSVTQISPFSPQNLLFGPFSALFEVFFFINDK